MMDDTIMTFWLFRHDSQRLTSSRTPQNNPTTEAT